MKVLNIIQELTPYTEETALSRIGRFLPEAVQGSGCEIRTFMPRWGTINERRNQLHEVIRLSGMNIIVGDTDNPLVIKVASIQAARMQVYFIDNDTYFFRRRLFFDENGKEYADNTERAIFFVRGVLETVKKLRWVPDVIYCQGWMGALAPLYIKTAYRDEPCFAETRVLYATGGQYPTGTLPKNFGEMLYVKAAATAAEEAEKDLRHIAGGLGRLGVRFADAVINSVPGQSPELIDFAHSLGKTVLQPEGETFEDTIASQVGFIRHEM